MPVSSRLSTAALRSLYLEMVCFSHLQLAADQTIDYLMAPVPLIVIIHKLNTVILALVPDPTSTSISDNWITFNKL